MKNILSSVKIGKRQKMDDQEDLSNQDESPTQRIKVELNDLRRNRIGLILKEIKLNEELSQFAIDRQRKLTQLNTALKISILVKCTQELRKSLC